MNYFWVNIGETYREVQENGFLWAPLPYSDQNGKLQNNAGWLPLHKAEIGDVFFCKNGHKFEYIAIVTKVPYESRRPEAREFDRWKQVGCRVDVLLVKLQNPIKSESIAEVFFNDYYDKCKPKVINKDRNFCEIYSSTLPEEAGLYLMSLIGADKVKVKQQSKAVIENNIDNYPFPYKSHSWNIEDTNTIHKTVDSTLVKEKSTGVPLDIVSFFHPSPLDNGQKVSLKVYVDNKQIDVILERKHDGRYRFNLASISNKAKLSRLNVGKDLLWFERSINDPNSFDIYISSINKNYSIIPKSKPKSTTTLSKVKTRKGQAYFKSQTAEISGGRCLVTGVKDQTPSILIGSHIKAWSICNDEERMDGENGILLAPHVDKLFDKYLITFSNKGEIIVSNKLQSSVLEQWGINLNKKFNLTSKQLKYMKAHRKVFKEKQS